jgi:uncharacterized ParB-like nuclease family protein
VGELGLSAAILEMAHIAEYTLHVMFHPIAPCQVGTGMVNAMRKTMLTLTPSLSCFCSWFARDPISGDSPTPVIPSGQGHC